MKFLKLSGLLVLSAILFSCSSQSIITDPFPQDSKVNNFTLPDQNKTMISLKDILKDQKGAVIAFYPKDDSKN